MNDDNVIPFPDLPNPADRLAPAPGGEIPIMLTGGPLTCHRCQAVTMPTTWVVREVDAGLQHAPICPTCSVQDPELWIWQSLCDIYDQIDDLMVTADNAEQRKLLGTLIAQEAPHFALRRKESDQGDQT